MSIVKRLIYIIVSLCSLFIVGSYAALVFCGYDKELFDLFENNLTFCYLAIGCLAVVGLYAAIQLLRALFVRNRKVVEIKRDGKDAILISRDAIASHIRHCVEEDGLVRARRIKVRSQKRGHVKVFVSLEAKGSYSAKDDGERLKEKLRESLLSLMGDVLDTLQIEFSSASEFLDNYDPSHEDFDQFADNSWEDSEDSKEFLSESDHDNSEVTVPMGYYSDSTDVDKEV